MVIRRENLLSSLRRHPRAARKAPRTIEQYSQSVRYFSAWLAELAENCEPSTVAVRLRGVRRFCGWLLCAECQQAPDREHHPQLLPLPIFRATAFAAAGPRCGSVA